MTELGSGRIADLSHPEKFPVGGVVEIEAEIIPDEKTGHRGARYRYTLDRERNWLPIRVVSLRKDGMIGVVTDFEYNEVLPKTWFAKQVATNYAGSYEIREITPEVQWSKTHLVYTFGQPEFNVAVSDAELTSLEPIENPNV